MSNVATKQTAGWPAWLPYGCLHHGRRWIDTTVSGPDRLGERQGAEVSPNHHTGSPAN